jgi:hypothetical protein
MENQFEFKKIDDWRNFCRYIQKENRFNLNDYWNDFFTALKHTAKKRENIIKNNFVMCRARIGFNEIFKEDAESGEPEIRMWAYRKEQIGAAPSDKSKNGRINPKGISYLYLSNDHKTAITEVRPLIKDTVSVGYFRANKNLKCIDTSDDKHIFIIPYDFNHDPPKYIEPSSEKKEAKIWGDINASFSKPVNPKDEDTEYLPTQYLSEYFKVLSYDGIIYKSSLSKDGYNIVLFDPKTVDYVFSKAFDIEAINYDLVDRSDLFCK